MGDWIMENLGWFLLGFIVLFVVMATVICISEGNERLEHETVLVRMGYEVGDIDAFVRVTDFSRRDLIVSQGARKQFERFLRGKEMKIKKTVHETSTVIVPIITGR